MGIDHPLWPGKSFLLDKSIIQNSSWYDPFQWQNDPINLTGAYLQNGPNITIDAVGHNLEVNTKIEILLLLARSRESGLRGNQRLL